jgi:4-carboxymuconolactone decarboxylase
MGMELRIAMKVLSAMMLVLPLSLGACAPPGKPAAMQDPRTPGGASPTREDMLAVSPALAGYSTGREDLWKRPGLSPRDWSIVTVAALVARGHTVDMSSHLERALDLGVKPAEVSEIIMHLAFYSGWASAMSAVPVARDVFERRAIRPDQLPPAVGDLLPLDVAAEAQRAARVEQSFGAVAPGVVQITTDLLFHELWLRPALAPRDRSLVTVSALVATGHAAQLSYHLNRAMGFGLTRTEVSEALTQLAFYAGWPSVFTSLPAVREVFEKRAEPHPG